MIRGTIRALVGAILVTMVFAATASADTLPGRAAPFAPAQAPGDQYTTPGDPVPPTTPPGQVGAEENPPSSSGRGDNDPDVGADDVPGPAGEQETAPGGDVGATVEPGATAPKAGGGSLPFTGSNLLALVWIALALVTAGVVAEVARRRLGATA